MDVLLKKKHQYFYQVQMQLNMLEVAFGFFVLWSPTDVFVEVISKDENCFTLQAEKASIFWKNCVLRTAYYLKF